MAEGFVIRHRVLLLISWAHVPVLAGIGLYLGENLVVVGMICLIAVTLSLTGMLLPGRGISSCAVSLGVTLSASALVYYGGDVGLMHLYLAVALVAVSYYRLSAPLLLGLTVLVTYHFVVGVWLLGTENVVEAGLHSALLTLLAAALALGWRLGPGEDTATPTTDRYWRSFHSAPIGMAVVKPSGEFLEVNAALARLLGYDPTHFPGRNIRAFVHGDDMTILGEAWEAIGNTRSETFSAWMRCITAGGESIWGRVSLALVPRTDEQNAMVILQVEDATTSRQETDRLERLLHGKDEFVATVGSEIRQPLGTLIDLTSADPLLRDAHTHAREVASVVDDLVASALADTAPPEVVPTDLDIAAIVRNVVDGLGDGGVSVDFRASRVWADPDLTRQIVTGMLGNAIRYGGPKVRVQVFNSGPDTVVQVIDDGPGIPATQQERIFSGDLRRGQPVTRPAAVGLSLTVGRYLARRMEGDITYRRSGDGFNIFELRLPSDELTKTYKPRPRPRIGSDLP
ncbi:MAG TPA: PAS domain-containing sensor histidine kinase [Acidimicrobiia bacterium]